ncbi:MAG TPA: ABC transporter permease subunit [Gemmataceae bacterium]|nr:ABC transporter permease subunit [Gemmataceae bacterium]
MKPVQPVGAWSPDHAPALTPGKRVASDTSVASALAALFVLTLRQHVRGRRLIVLSLLFLLPTVLTVIVKLAAKSPPQGWHSHLEFVLVLNLIPSALATLTALLYAAGIVQDEVEEQTLTYLLLRPLPRWAIYVTKLLATVLVTSLLTAAFTLLAMVAIYWDALDQWHAALLQRAPRTVALLTLAQAGYCSFFGVVSLLIRRSLIVGIGYIIIFEGLLANLDTVIRRLTVMYYFRVLVLRWFDPADSKGWSIELDTAPSAGDCVLTLLGVSLVFTLIGAWMMMRKEFRMKTPEGS